jgi:hypothetical protein
MVREKETLPLFRGAPPRPTRGLVRSIAIIKQGRLRCPWAVLAGQGRIGACGGDLDSEPNDDTRGWCQLALVTDAPGSASVARMVPPSS